MPVTGWEELARSVKEAGVGTAAFVVVGRPNRIGHAMVLAHSDTGLVKIDPTTPPPPAGRANAHAYGMASVSAEELRDADGVGPSLIETRALIITPNGRPRALAIPATVGALTDPVDTLIGAPPVPADFPKSEVTNDELVQAAADARAIGISELADFTRYCRADMDWKVSNKRIGVAWSTEKAGAEVTEVQLEQAAIDARATGMTSSVKFSQHCREVKHWAIGNDRAFAAWARAKNKPSVTSRDLTQAVARAQSEGIRNGPAFLKFVRKTHKVSAKAAAAAWAQRYAGDETVEGVPLSHVAAISPPADPATAAGYRPRPGPQQAESSFAGSNAPPRPSYDPPRMFSPAPGAQRQAPAGGASGPDSAQARRLLAQFGLDLVEVPSDGDCFFNAFLRTLGHNGTAVELRTTLAQDLENPQVRERLLQTELQAAERSWINRSRAGVNLALLHADPTQLQATMWREIANQIRTGDWAGEGGDLAAHLAAARFGIQIRVLFPHGGHLMIGNALDPTITLYHPSNHWDGTRIRTSPPSIPGHHPHGGYGAGGSGWSGQNRYGQDGSGRRGMRQAIRDDPRLQPLQAGPIARTDEHGFTWFSPSPSAYDAHGDWIAPEEQACVNVAIITLIRPTGG